MKPAGLDLYLFLCDPDQLDEASWVGSTLFKNRLNMVMSYHHLLLLLLVVLYL